MPTLLRFCCAFAVLSVALLAEELSPAAQRLRADVQYLASDELEGRGLGTEGLKKAAEFITTQFREAGLSVSAAGGDSYQDFEIVDGAKLTEPNSLAFAGPDGNHIELKLGDSFQVCSFGEAGTVTAPLVFAGYGIDTEEAQYNDFDGIDVQGKVVILVRRNPNQAEPHGAFASGHGVSRHAALTTKVSRAFSRGAVAILFVNDYYTGTSERADLETQRQQAEQQVVDAATKLVAEGDTGTEQPDLAAPQQALKDAVVHLTEVQALIAEHKADVLMNFGYGGTRGGKSLPIFHVSQAAVEQLLAAAGKPALKTWEANIDETGTPHSFELTGWQANATASLQVIRRNISNVVGVLEGKGDLARETVVIGAHFDHLGYGEEGSMLPGSKDIHNGADDNASGTSGLLELARRFGARGAQARRLVFIAFTGEERGLLGSAEYCKNPLFPLEETVAMLNLDMIGRLDKQELSVFGTGTSTGWEPVLSTSAEVQGLTLIKKPEGFGPSDHSSFYGKKIPVLHFFTGIHSDYHRPSDDWQSLNLAGMEQIVTMVEDVALTAANAPQRLDYIEIAGQAELARTGNRPYFGSIPDFSTNATGYAISGVAPGSPADKGGLKGGDVIIRLGEQQVGSLDDFDLALRKFKPGEQITVTVQRGTEQVELKVTLATPKG